MNLQPFTKRVRHPAAILATVIAVILCAVLAVKWAANSPPPSISDEAAHVLQELSLNDTAVAILSDKRGFGTRTTVLAGETDAVAVDAAARKLRLSVDPMRGEDSFEYLLSETEQARAREHIRFDAVIHYFGTTDAGSKVHLWFDTESGRLVLVEARTR